VVAELRRSLEQGRFPHALLFVGPHGVGKHAFARRLAQALLCERRPVVELDPCGTCPSCLQVAAGTQPDLLTVGRPEEKHELPIEAIRRLCLDLGLKPMRGTRRVAIVDDADDLSEEASNAFLKTLEEPPPGAVLILIGTSAELQLDTILSRCRVVRFEPLSDGDLRAVLLEQQIAADATEAARLAVLGEGSVGRAAGLADPDLAAFRRELYEALADPRGFDAPALSRRIEEFVADAGKESALRRERAGLLAGELARLFRGVLRETAGAATGASDPADRKVIAALAERLDTDAAIDLADRCLLADYHVARKANLPLIFDALLHDLGRRMSLP
jgi:DNA polymerase-3 subunit delta'